MDNSIKQVAKAAGVSEEFALKVLGGIMNMSVSTLSKVGVGVVESATYLVKEASNRKKILK